MTIESDIVSAFFTSGDDGLECLSISELVSILRSTFRVKDFDKVEEALVTKEVKLRKVIEDKNKENELLQSQYEFLRLDNLTHESILKKDKVNPQPDDDLKEREREILKLKELIFKVDEDRAKKIRAAEGFEKLLEEVNKTQKEDRKYIEELKCQNSKLECAKREVEHKYELSQGKYDELRHRVSQLEKKCTLLQNGEPIAPNKNDAISGGANFSASGKLGGKRGAENDRIENPTGTGGCAVEIISDDDHTPTEKLPKAHRNQKRKWDLLLNDCEDYVAETDIEKMSLKKVGAKFATSPHGRPDNHVLKKHFSPGTNNNKNAISSSKTVDVMSKEECKSQNSKIKHALLDIDYDYSIYSESEGNIQNRYDSSRRKSKNQEKRRNRKWESEAEMCSAFDESDTLCMEAVCVLYRQSSLIGSSRSAYHSIHRGFHEADVLRGTTLALFLTNGGSHGRLKRSVMELEKFDICGLIDCRRIAIDHLKQLFELYKNNEDLFLFQ